MLASPGCVHGNIATNLTARNRSFSSVGAIPDGRRLVSRRAFDSEQKALSAGVTRQELAKFGYVEMGLVSANLAILKERSNSKRPDWLGQIAVMEKGYSNRATRKRAWECPS
jgi:hypothetical protein